MQTPLPSSSDRLQAARTGISIVLTGAIMLLAAAMAVQASLEVHRYQEQRRQQQEQQQQEHLLRQQQQQEQQQREILAEAESLRDQQNYWGCMATAQQISFGTALYSHAQIVENQCQTAYAGVILQQAQAMADAGRLKDAIAHLRYMPPGLDNLVQQWQSYWSQRILDIAEEQYRSSSDQFVQAIAIAQAISADSSLYHAAQQRVEDWRNERSTNQKHLRAAQVAMATQDFDTAWFEVDQVTDHPYWQQQAETVRQAIYQHQQQAAVREAERQHRLERLLLVLIPSGVGASVALAQCQRS
ncbi:MAG: hypothetical protein IGS50_00525 [Synechococcales cyanobacterium C42_A2020_086]|jgi:hypothetical protein|nr:hypothetical protein [Synechococcales cyanobacterium C42_A2020_086]